MIPLATSVLGKLGIIVGPFLLVNAIYFVVKIRTYTRDT